MTSTLPGLPPLPKSLSGLLAGGRRVSPTLSDRGGSPPARPDSRTESRQDLSVVGSSNASLNAGGYQGYYSSPSPRLSPHVAMTNYNSSQRAKPPVTGYYHKPGYENRGQAYDTREQTYDTREQSYDSREPTYDTREQTYDTREQAYDTREKTYDSREQTYDSKKPPYENRSQTYDSREKTYDTKKPAYENRGQSYDRREQSYDNKKLSYENRGHSYNREQSYDNKSQTYDNRSQTYDSREQMYDNREQNYVYRDQLYDNKRGLTYEKGSYESRGPTYDNKSQLYDSKGQTYDSKGQVYDSKGQTYDSKSQVYDSKGQMYRAEAELYNNSFAEGGQKEAKYMPDWQQQVRRDNRRNSDNRQDRTPPWQLQVQHSVSLAAKPHHYQKVSPGNFATHGVTSPGSYPNIPANVQKVSNAPGKYDTIAGMYQSTNAPGGFSQQLQEHTASWLQQKLNKPRRSSPSITRASPPRYPGSVAMSPSDPHMDPQLAAQFYQTYRQSLQQKSSPYNKTSSNSNSPSHDKSSPSTNKSSLPLDSQLATLRKEMVSIAFI